tara:strand:+ start:760 stop:1791 length:1032 start_codon:yes stop_codon:yes gene_type:complete
MNLSFFDIDETVFNTFANVLVRKKLTGKLVTKLDNQTFNSYELKDDEEYDFSEFKDAKLFRGSSKVIKGTMKEVKRQFRDRNTMIIFLTARQKMDDNATFKDAFRDQGLRVNDKRIRFELVGNLKSGTIPDKKEYVIRKFLKKFKQIERVSIYDDHRENVDILNKVSRDYPDIQFRKFLVTNGVIKSAGQLNFKEWFTEEKNPRIPRKKGQPAKSKKHSDLYTDEDPRGTIHGLGFKDVETAKKSVSKIKDSGRSHAHKIQAAIAMEQRARVMGKTAEAAVYRKYINQMKKKTKEKNESAPNTADAMKRYRAGKAGFTDVAHLKAKGLIKRSDGTKRKSDKYK